MTVQLFLPTGSCCAYSFHSSCVVYWIDQLEDAFALRLNENVVQLQGTATWHTAAHAATISVTLAV